MSWRAVIWTTTTIFSEVCPVSTCVICSVFKTHLVGLLEIAIITNGLLLFSKNSIVCQLKFGVFSKLPLWFRNFFTVVTQAISALIFLFIVEDMAQDTTAQIKGSWWFLNTTHQYTNPKHTSVIVLLLMLPHFGIICLMMSVLFQILPVSGKS